MAESPYGGNCHFLFHAHIPTPAVAQGKEVLVRIFADCSAKAKCGEMRGVNITNIIVRAGRTFNHPHEQYSNLRPEVELHATLSEGEDADTAAKALQSRAEGLVEDHKNNLLKSIEELHELTAAQAEWAGLGRQLRAAQSGLEDLRKKHPRLAEQLTLSNGDEP